MSVIPIHRQISSSTCLSIYFHNFNAIHPYASVLTELGRHYCDYVSLMRHWKESLDLPIFDIQYESLVDDPEGTIRAMLSFCGLEWNPACLRFHESGRAVSTPSYDQVRRPLYTSSVGRWKQYAKYLRPLLSSLDSCGEQGSFNT